MPTSIIIIDDFLTDPDAIRQGALQLEYPPQEGYFPGRNSAQRARLQGLDQEISRLTGEPLAPVENRTSHAKFRITLGSDEGKGDIHIDHQASWSGILYLSKPEDCQGGTDFFRHIPTNSERAPINDQELKAMGFANASEMAETIIGRDGIDRSKWEHTMRVPMRYNRLLLLRPWLWHTAGPGFGDRMENGRLVYLLFYNSPDLARIVNSQS